MNVDRLLEGSIDMHLHPSPDVSPRCVDFLEASRQALQARMKAIVIKNHLYPTAPLATTANRIVSGIDVFGSICLDYEVGGLNFHALESSARLGAKVVWMPTFSSANCRAKVRELLGLPLEGDGFTILDTEGKLVPEINRILLVIKEYDMILASGHMSPSEIFALVEGARKIGIWKLIITHPSEAVGLEEALTLGDQKRLAEMGALLEYTAAGLLDPLFGHTPKDVAEDITAIGAEHVIMSSDLGQKRNPPPVEGMKMFISSLLSEGITEGEIEMMVKMNPGKLLDLNEVKAGTTQGEI
ncbi:DUF6282 family protein [Thermodesulfobacteriota bacterium]